MNAPSARSKSRVLLADDEWLVCWSLERHLVRHGIEVVTASNGSEALNLIQQDDVDWLITDLKMPDISGFELIEQARRLRPGMRMILMTAYGSSAVAAEARRLGVIYLAKPFDLDQVAAIVLAADTAKP